MGKGLVIFGLILTLIATIFIYLGSRHSPWNMQTWDGSSDKENKFFKGREIERKIGFLLLFLGFSLQLIGVIIS